MELNRIHLADCMDLMAYIKAQQEAGNPVFDKRRILAIVDPEYGIGESKKQRGKERSGKKNKRWASQVWKDYHDPKDWDLNPCDANTILEIVKISKNQIIWGGNYFANLLSPSSGWVFWDKDNGESDFSDGELAYTSFNKGLRKFKYLWNGFQKQKPETRIHPTQKPVALMIWLLDNYAKPGDLILDTHSGSGSVARACVKRGFDFIASELDPDYHRDSLRLLADAKAGIIPRSREELLATGAQPSLFDL